MGELASRLCERRVEIHNFPPMRKKQSAWMGHGAFMGLSDKEGRRKAGLLTFRWMRHALCGGTGLDDDGRDRNDGGRGTWTRINAAKIGARAKGGRGGAGRQVGADLLCVRTGRVGGDQGDADVGDHVVAGGGEEG